MLKLQCIGKKDTQWSLNTIEVFADSVVFYYRGLKEWNKEQGYLMDTCLAAQDRYKAYLDYFRIAY